MQGEITYNLSKLVAFGRLDYVMWASGETRASLCGR